ncbi:unnamed protein product [Clavelina lepadiformis]|uniref:Uncharacterized protein n=1 Tax=Clavelina lepadiformis TaxID=159417 RepID=A0ABP0G5R4_CLALP
MATEIMTRINPGLLSSYPSGFRTVFSSRRSENAVEYDCSARLRREMTIQMLGLKENKPTKFATTAWTRTQVPYLTYRSIALIHAICVLCWKSITESIHSQTEIPWTIQLSSWTFILYTGYQLTSFLLALLQFFHDCLCNDDPSWYHKVCWILQTISFNGSLACFIGSLIHIIASAAGDQIAKDWSAVFSSNDVNFYVVMSLAMITDVLVTNTTVRLLHVFYSAIFYVIFFVFHIYRWAAGNTPAYVVLDYGNHPDLGTIFIIVVLLLVCPLCHVTAYGLDTLRWKLLLVCIKRHQRRFIEVSNAAQGIMTYNMEDSRMRGRFEKTPRTTSTYYSTLS